MLFIYSFLFIYLYIYSLFSSAVCSVQYTAPTFTMIKANNEL